MPADIPHSAIASASAWSGSRAKLAGWTLFLWALALTPVLLFRFPGLQDYPNHLARAFILLHRNDPVLDRLYTVQWSMLPNLGWDIWAVTVGRILSLEWTGRLFLMLSQSAILLGCFALSRALHGRWMFAPLLAVPFLFNSGFTQGFLNFELSVGIALLAAAWWVWMGEQRWLLRLIGATILSSLLYVIHFYGFAFYGIFVLGRELQLIIERRDGQPRWRRIWRLGRDALQAVPALVLMSVTLSTDAPGLALKAFQPPFIRIIQVRHLINVGEIVANIVLLLFAAAIAVMIVRGRCFRFRFDFALTLILCVGFFFLLPDQIGETHYVAWRILFMAALIAIASLSDSKGALIPSDRIVGAVAALTAAIVGILIWSWHNAELGREAFLRLIRDIPDGSALFVIHNKDEPRYLVERYPLYHVGSYAVMAKRALVQSLFVFPGQQPLRFRDPAFQSIPDNTSGYLLDLQEARDRNGFDIRSRVLPFDFAVVHGPDDGNELDILPRDHLTLIDRIGDFRLYRIKR